MRVLITVTITVAGLLAVGSALAVGHRHGRGDRDGAVSSTIENAIDELGQ